jgi:hypothetical protein
VRLQSSLFFLVSIAPLAVAQVPLPTTSGTGFAGVPYSATETTIAEHTTLEGVRYTDTNVTLLWRDADGRTRQEHVEKTPTGVEHRGIAVIDPIAGVTLKWTVGSDIEKKVATIWPLAPRERVTAKIANLPPLNTSSGGETSCGPDCTREGMVLQEINGLQAQGWRTKRIIHVSIPPSTPDLTITNELWTSPELRIIVRHVTEDPRTGETTTNVTDVIRGDPAPELFKIPDGYQTRDMRQAAIHRESVADLAAKLDPSQKEHFDEAVKSFRESRFSESLSVFRQLLKDFPGDPILSKYAGEAAINAGDPSSALAILKPVAEKDPDDWQAHALLVRACAESSDTVCRDAEMTHMADLRSRGLTPSELYEYVVENVKLDTGTLQIKNSLVPWGYYKVYALGKFSDKSGNLVLTVSLESNDMDQPGFAKEHPAEAAKGLRSFSLDAYRETGLNSAGKRTQTHYTYQFLIGQPDYATVRQDFLDIVTGKRQPLSSRTGLVEP